MAALFVWRSVCSFDVRCLSVCVCLSLLLGVAVEFASRRNSADLVGQCFSGFSADSGSYPELRGVLSVSSPKSLCQIGSASPGMVGSSPRNRSEAFLRVLAADL